MIFCYRSAHPGPADSPCALMSLWGDCVPRAWCFVVFLRAFGYGFVDGYQPFFHFFVLPALFVCLSFKNFPLIIPHNPSSEYREPHLRSHIAHEPAAKNLKSCTANASVLPSKWPAAVTAKNIRRPHFFHQFVDKMYLYKVGRPRT